ncbi:MAG: FG-GAP-like repeat-containing protein [Phycisphaerae bacterium]
MLGIATAVPVHAADCNSNGLDDATDVAGGTSFDCDANGVPDECEVMVTFSDEKIITTGAGRPQYVYAADLDGDGNADVLYSSAHDDKIAWYKNIVSVGTFGHEQIITTATDFAQSVITADLDGDGDQDVLSASRSDDKIAWYENIAGTGTFGPQQIISTATDGATSVFAADLDNDGDLDVLSASENDDKIAWYENTDGAGTFGPQLVITNLANEAESVFAADLDGDGDYDVLSASSEDGKTSWYENTDGLGTFGPRRDIAHSNNVFSVYAADLDGDGDSDVLTASWGSFTIEWYENLDGMGNFGSLQLIASNRPFAHSAIATDLDGDGDLDVLSASGGDDKIAWYENIDGLGDFGPQQIISATADGAYTVFTIDLDGDGDADVLSASENDDKIAWYENKSLNDCNRNGTPDGCDIADATSTDCNNNGEPDDCELAGNDCNANHVPDDCELANNDCNTNGLPDDCELVGNDCNTNHIPDDCDFADQIDPDCGINGIPDACEPDCNANGVPDDCDILDQTSIDCNSNSVPDDCELVGNDCNLNDIPDDCELETAFATPSRVVGPADDAKAVFAEDLDGDGDVDVIAGSIYDNRLLWYENTDGHGDFHYLHYFASPFRPESVFAADVDGDGDPDVLSASSNDDTVAWYENTDGMGTYGPQRTITTTADYAISVYASDLDGDGDFDALSASQFDDKIAWYENIDGLGTFGIERVISTEANGASCVISADLDGDGDYDVLSTSRLDRKVAWYENTDGLGTFGPQQVITTSARSANSVFAADLDGDGDYDVLSASSDDDKIAWYENTDGKGSFGPQRIITVAANGASSVFGADVDGDGDIDALSASFNDDKIAWYENTDGLGGFGPLQVITTNANYAYSVLAADVDGDGDLDAVSASILDPFVRWYENITINDCNDNEILDACDIAAATSNDCNTNGIPDECEAPDTDCNMNGTPDLCELTYNDCNDNGVPDDCELAGFDCNNNGILDQCDIAESTSADCNHSDVPDECELANNDCNTNGIPDECDALQSPKTDCNSNGVPDSCELTINDCNLNSTPDDCDIAEFTSPDCNFNGVPDECDVVIADCNSNSIPDECDVAEGTSNDCNENNVPDECESECGDCNTNGIPDLFDIAEATSTDCNRNSIPDECEPDGDDCNENGIRDDCELQPDFSAKNIIGYPSYAGTIIAIDLDGDGDKDVLTESTSDATVAWYRNVDGAGNFGPATIISTAQISGLSIFAADVDSDGDADVFVTSSNEHDKVYWYENVDGMGHFGPRQVIDVFTASGDFPIFVADLDSDGDADVLTAKTRYGDVVWYENLDGLGSFGQEREITPSTSATDSLFAADLDGDGDNDVLAADGYYGRVVWHENLDGLGDFSPRTIISSDAHDVNQVLATDLDGDGDLDVLTAGENLYTIAWYENTDGPATFGSQQVINNPDEGERVVSATDFDADGDIDILSVSSVTDTIAWYENIGGQAVFAPRQVIVSSTGIWRVLEAADLDGDGDLDVLANHDIDDTLAWHEHINHDCNQNMIPDDCDISGGTSEDINNNQTPDMCEPDCNDSGFPDDYDVLNLLSEDCNFNLQPDECEDDCNGSGVPDDCDVANQTSDDCNFNNFPDECELFGNDCNTDNIPDDCQLTQLEDSLSTPTELYACPGQDAQITVSSSLTGLAYNWQKIGVPMVEGVDAIGTDTATLTILNADSFDIGTYFCEVSLGCISSETERISLFLYEPFNIEQQPAATYNACMGNTVAIGVAATGNELTYEWLKDGIPISEIPGKYENVATSTLHIVDVNQNDLAEYSCIVRDQCGGEESTTSAFNQFGDATFVTQPIGQCVSEGDTVSYTAVADGGAYSVFRQWHKDGVPLVDGGNISGSFTNTLVIQNVSAANQGTYAQRALTIGANCTIFSDSVELDFDSCSCDIPGDMDSDGDLDLADLHVFAKCFGTTVGELAGCACANVDNTDQSIDLDDWAAYANILTGP